MEIEWTDTDPASGERRFVRARKFACVWEFHVRFRRRTNWQAAPEVTRPMWETLLDALERRYVRRQGVSDADLAAVRAVLARLRPPPAFDGSEALAAGSSQAQTCDGSGALAADDDRPGG